MDLRSTHSLLSIGFEALRNYQCLNLSPPILLGAKSAEAGVKGLVSVEENHKSAYRVRRAFLTHRHRGSDPVR